MRIVNTNRLHSVSGENIIIRQDATNADLTTVIGLNDSAMHLYRSLEGRDFTVDDAVAALCEAYDVSPATARADAEEWIAAMRTNQMLAD